MDGGRLVWAPDEKEGFTLGTIVDVGTETLTIQPRSSSSQTIQVPYNRLFLADEDDSRTADDNCSLMYLNEATLLHNLRLRYHTDIIYTFVANILLAVNPYHELKIYDAEHVKRYHNKSLGQLPPHIYSIADKAYRDMRISKQSQSIIVSGESGAGKTESTKYIIRYLTESWGQGAGTIEQRIVEANPLLEAFGNAKTVRNDNSSRFGKFVEIHFDSQSSVVGGFISHYLLEKSRICVQSKYERNYHIFYALCGSLPDEQKKKLYLKNISDYKYLNHGDVDITTRDNVGDFKRMEASMNKLNIDITERFNIYRLVSAVLQLGNITFEEDLSDSRGGSNVCDESKCYLQNASRLLCLDESDLANSLTTRVMTTARGGTKGTVYMVPLKPEQCTNARDALAKAIYSRLFDAVVGRINSCIPFKSTSNYIGVLDIAGFEYFRYNSFEQFCINYCNEKLQQYFNNRVLIEEQKLYEVERLGISPVSFTDNQDCIDIIEAKPNGIFNLLDEESKLPKSSCEHFTLAVHDRYDGHFRLMAPRKSAVSTYRTLRNEEGFIIRHFAGAVCYATRQFIEKNNDALHTSLEMLIHESKDLFLKGVFCREVESDKPKSKKSNTSKLALVSVGNKFKTQLKELMGKLESTGSSFIRCIKPNGTMSSNVFEGGSVLSQLQCAGMVSVLKLMQTGFPSRTSFKDLYQRYKGILPEKLACLDPRLFCKALFRAVGMNDQDFQFGLTKVFFRAGKFAEFDQIMKSDNESLKQMVAKVEKWLIRARWRKVIWGALSVIKLHLKIMYRRHHRIVIQKNVRTFLAIRKHRHRYKGMAKVTTLFDLINQMEEIARELEGNHYLNQVQGLDVKIKHLIHEIRNKQIDENHINNSYDSLLKATTKQLEDLKIQLKDQRIAKEEERVRKLQEQMELERKRREEEEEKKRKEEEERRIKEDMEAKRKQEEEEMKVRKLKEEEEMRRLEDLRKKRELEEQEARRKQEEEEERKRRLAEQELHDRELAARIAAESGGSVVKENPNTLNRKKPEKNDLSGYTYAQLRDIINTSCDVELLQRCREECHRRLKVYHAWKERNKQQVNVANSQPLDQRAPQVVYSEASSRRNFSFPDPFNYLPNDQPQRFFRVPFNTSGPVPRPCGWWFAHFDGDWVVRQLELHSGRPPVLLLAGIDDMNMCELRLQETGLATRPGAEILPEAFEEIWHKCGGKPYQRIQPRRS
ncbi:Unconventional myosin-VI [Trichoplax sp. H2]|nr:Unconventional myosin-VI [Trichoplax sp. H2]|eukprot:RDD45946.1 Unconventional myosin-VI [Trichoplax sp. H2]